MGFFKKIGQGIKKASKQISLKNVIKIGASFDPTGIVGNIQNAHYENKAAKQAEAHNQAQEAEYFAQLSKTSAQAAGASAVRYAVEKSVVQNFIDGGVGAAGAVVIDSSVKGYFERYKKQIYIGLGVVAALVLYKFKDKIFGSGKQQPKRKKY